MVTALNIQRTNSPKLLLKRNAPTISSTFAKYSSTPTPYEVIDKEEEKRAVKDVINTVNTQLKNNESGRLFAVVHVAGKQFKITSGDVIVIEGYWPPDVGDKITLDKVLLTAGKNFSLIGRPFVQKGLVHVEATVIEKSLSHTKINFKKKRRKQYMRTNFFRIPQTYLRINSIDITGEVGKPPEVHGLDTAIF